jgi:hypothetical protein
LTVCKCALAFMVRVVGAVLACVAGRAACAPPSATRPEAAVGRPRNLVALLPFAQPRLPPPPLLAPDGAAMPVAV